LSNKNYLAILKAREYEIFPEAPVTATLTGAFEP